MKKFNFIGKEEIKAVTKVMKSGILSDFIGVSGDKFNGGEKVKELEIQNLETNETYSVPCNQFMLATGHSARDVFELLHKKEITIEFKPFALGVRVEHPQELINQIQ